MGYYSIGANVAFEEPFSDSETLEHEREFRERKNRLECLVKENSVILEGIDAWLKTHRERYSNLEDFFNYYLSEGGYEHLKENIKSFGSRELKDAFDAYSKKRDLFMNKYFRLVFHYAKKFSKNYNKKKQAQLFDEFFQEGYLGLVKALEYHNPADSQFKTFAVWCIRSSIIDCLRKMKRSKAERLTDGDCVNEQAYLKYKKRNGYAMPNHNSRVVKEVIEKDQNRHLDALLNEVLNPDERRLIELYLGLFGKEQVEPKEIASRLDISYNAVRTRKCVILKKLRQYAEQLAVA